MTPAARHRHRKPRRRPQRPGRLLTWLRQRRTARAIERARDDAYLARIEHHEPSPLTAVQVEVDALTAVLAAATGPLPAAMQAAADDPRYSHLNAGQYGGWTTGQFQAISDDIEGGQDASPAT